MFKVVNTDIFYKNLLLLEKFSFAIIFIIYNHSK